MQYAWRLIQPQLRSIMLGDPSGPATGKQDSGRHPRSVRCLLLGSLPISLDRRMLCYTARIWSCRRAILLRVGSCSHSRKLTAWFHFTSFRPVPAAQYGFSHGDATSQSISVKYTFDIYPKVSTQGDFDDPAKSYQKRVVAVVNGPRNQIPI
jgi:hypothetical protein